MKAPSVPCTFPPCLQAWILPALTNPERAPLYYSLAALYAAPLLRNGFDLDSYVWAMWALMIVHIQVRAHRLFSLGAQLRYLGGSWIVVWKLLFTRAERILDALSEAMHVPCLA